MRLATVCFLIGPKHIYLAQKKRLHGKNLLNGYGGRRKRGESAIVMACRELYEEAKIIVGPSDLQRVAVIDFFELDKHLFHCDVFFVQAWQGVPRETDEMGKPEKFLRATGCRSKECRKEINYGFPDYAGAKNFAGTSGIKAAFGEFLNFPLEHCSFFQRGLGPLFYCPD